jgi:hypothetical protein
MAMYWRYKMPWKIFMVKQIENAVWELPNGKQVGFDDLPVGAMYLEEIGTRRSGLSAHYKNNVASIRKPLVVKLPTNPYTHVEDTGPGGVLFWIDMGFSDGTGWEVSGEAPTLTLTPSINYEHGYHGYIKNGVITDDCEGRTYPQFPNTA